MIDVKTAVKTAIDYVASLFDPDEILDVRLEEVERSEDDRFWYVTIGFDWRYRSPLKFAPDVPVPFRKDPSGQREFKRVKIDAQSGEVLSMHIRAV